MPPNNRSTSNAGNASNENEMMAVKASKAAAQKMMNNDPKRYRNQRMATTNMYGWNTVETGAPIPAMPSYPAPLPPHKNTKLALNQKINKAMTTLTSNGLSAARKYLINTKATSQYTKERNPSRSENYTPEWILAKESAERRTKKNTNNRNRNMSMRRYLASAKGGRKTHRKRKTLRKTRSQQ
jgi:hypothetical protein